MAASGRHLRLGHIGAESSEACAYRRHRDVVNKALRNVRFIMGHYERIESEQQVNQSINQSINQSTSPRQDIDEWKFVATVVDRIFLIVYALLNCATFTMIVRAPSLWDEQAAMTSPPAHRPVSHGFLQL